MVFVTGMVPSASFSIILDPPSVEKFRASRNMVTQDLRLRYFRRAEIWLLRTFSVETSHHTSAIRSTEDIYSNPNITVGSQLTFIFRRAKNRLYRRFHVIHIFSYFGSSFGSGISGERKLSYIGPFMLFTYSAILWLGCVGGRK